MGINEQISPLIGAPRALALVLALPLAACLSEPNITSGVVGPQAATLTLPGLASLQVANGALSAPVQVTVAASLAPVPVPGSALSRVIEFTPHGTQFAVPAKISLRYEGATAASNLRVWRLPDADAKEWVPVGSGHFVDGVATFESTGFSYYVVTDSGQCTLVDGSAACTSACTCCGTSRCVSLDTGANCGACGNSCGKDRYCAAGGQCLPTSNNNLCKNTSLYVMRGEIPDLSVPNPLPDPDGVQGALIAQAIADRCRITPVTLSQATPGVLDPCTDAPLFAKAGSTVVLAGGVYAQRLSRFLSKGLAPLAYTFGTGGWTATFTTRAGTVLGPYENFSQEGFRPGHDYFVIAFVADPVSGALVLNAYGLGYDGTVAAAWYFTNRVLPDMVAGTRTWKSWVLVEWSDDGDKVPGASDSFKVLAQDLP